MEMLQEYQRVQDDIPACLTPLMKAFYARMEEQLDPGMNAITWRSPNIDHCNHIIIVLIYKCIEFL